MGGIVKGISDAVSGAINTVEDVGKAAGDLVSGNVGGAVGDLGQAGSSLIGTAVNGFMATNPEISKLGNVGNMIGGLLGQAGGFNPAQAGGSPLPFGLGNLLPGILQNPLGCIFGGGPGGGTSLPGLPGGTGGSTGAGGAGGENWSQLQSDMQAAAKSGDPMQMMQAQQKINQYQEMVTMLSTMQKAEHDLLMGIMQKIA